ncbi:MAG: hypothetical protein ABMB14_03080 [Myxococcota bacterium]
MRQRRDRTVRGALLAAGIALVGVGSMTRPDSAPTPQPHVRWAIPDAATPAVWRLPGEVEPLEVGLGPRGTLHLERCCSTERPANLWRATPGALGWLGPQLWRIPAPDVDPRWVARAGGWLAATNPWLGVAATSVASRWWRYPNRDQAAALEALADAAAAQADGGGAAAQASLVSAEVGHRIDRYASHGADHGRLGAGQRRLLDLIRDADPTTAALALGLLAAPAELPVDAPSLAALRDALTADPASNLGAVAFGAGAAIAADVDVAAWVALADRADDTCTGWSCEAVFHATWRGLRARVAPPRDWRDALVAAVIRCGPQYPRVDGPLPMGWFGDGVYQLDGWTFTAPHGEWMFDCAADVDVPPPLGQRVALRISIEPG